MLPGRPAAGEYLYHTFTSKLLTSRKNTMSSRLLNPVLAVCLAASFFSPLRAADTPVKAWEEKMVIPTYLIGPPDLNPRFYVKGDVSQGAEHRVYPYPAYDNLTNDKEDKTYKMVYLENEYVRVGILPEIGGKIFEAIDKTNGYNFFYRQHVIKPTLISLLGAWISGGVEWDLPHHHRATSFLPVQYAVEEDADGSKTIWVGELELRDRMRWSVGVTLHPGKSYLDVAFRMVNRTPLPVSMLSFSNVAVHTNNDYQVIFPPSTQYVTGHSKRQVDMDTWPLSNGARLAAGTDLGWWKNHANGTSVFAWNYQDDFMAGYDHGRHAGTMAVDDHNVVPGKKFFTFGTSSLQSKLLTDNDGPYIELMVGAYSDNQPDYSWIQPYESRTWTQYWYPFRDIDGVKNANIDAAVNLEVKDGAANVGFFTTSAHPSATVSLKLKDRMLLSEQIAIDPGKPFIRQVPMPAGADEHDLRAAISADGRELVSYSPIVLPQVPMPKGVPDYLPPEQIKTNDELYLTGLRIEQFRDPTLYPEPYWEEALRRDPGDVRVNTALAINYYKKARYADAEKLLRKALERATAGYTSPKDGEPFYYLGLALKAQGKYDEAYTSFYKSTWSAAWRSPGYFEVAQIASIRGDANAALKFAGSSLDANALNIRALALKSALLRAAGRPQEALALAPAYHRVDPLDVRVMTEQWLAGSEEAAGKLSIALRDFPNTGLETAVEYMNAGLWKDASAILNQTIKAAPDRSTVSPLVYYYLSYFAGKMGRPQEAAAYLELAFKAPTDYVFPFQREAIEVLEQAMAANPADARAPYYLGNLLYDWQPQRAVALWEQSAAAGADFPVVYRNLAMVYRQQNAPREKIYAILEKGARNGGNATILAELDQMHVENGLPPEKRLALIERNRQLINRDDIVARDINLKILAGQYDDAIALIKSRLFRAWEGGPGQSVGDSWVNAMLGRGRQDLAGKRYTEALADFQAAGIFPDNIAEATAGADLAHRSEIGYWVGVAYDLIGDRDHAQQAWRDSAAPDKATPAPGRGGRGGRSTGALGAGVRLAQANNYYQAMSLLKLGETDRANAMFQQLVDSGTKALAGATEIEATATSAQRIKVGDAHCIIGLGRLGLGDAQKARQEFTLALQASPDHLAAKIALAGFSL
jgi:tetratricopeptide (TPR) repeat protein